jgi:hypothetical protein
MRDRHSALKAELDIGARRGCNGASRIACVPTACQPNAFMCVGNIHVGRPFGKCIIEQKVSFFCNGFGSIVALPLQSTVLIISNFTDFVKPFANLFQFGSIKLKKTGEGRGFSKT